jgi:hypothetical protein
VKDLLTTGQITIGVLAQMSVHLQCVTFELSIGTNTFKLSPNQRLNVRSPVRYANPDAPNE